MQNDIQKALQCAGDNPSKLRDAIGQFTAEVQRLTQSVNTARERSRNHSKVSSDFRRLETQLEKTKNEVINLERQLEEKREELKLADEAKKELPTIERSLKEYQDAIRTLSNIR